MNDAPYPREFEIDTTDAAPLGEWDVAEHLEQLWSMRSNMTFRARRELEATTKLEDRLDRLQKHWGNALRTAVANADELRHVVEELERSVAAFVEGETETALDEEATAATDDTTTDETQPPETEPAATTSVVDDAPEGDGAVVVEGQSNGWFGWFLGGGEKSSPAASPGRDDATPGSATVAVAARSSPRPTPSAAPPRPSPPAEHIDVLGRLWRLNRSRLEQLDVHYVPLLGLDLDTVEFEGRPVKRWVTVKNKPSGEKLVVATEILGLWIRVEGDALTLLQRAEILLH